MKASMNSKVRVALSNPVTAKQFTEAVIKYRHSINNSQSGSLVSHPMPVQEKK